MGTILGPILADLYTLVQKILWPPSRPVSPRWGSISNPRPKPGVHTPGDERPARPRSLAGHRVRRGGSTGRPTGAQPVRARVMIGGFTARLNCKPGVSRPPAGVC